MVDQLQLPRRILITASRTWSDLHVIRDALAFVWHPQVILVSGNARGGDRLCEACWEAWGGTVERHPADWSQGRGAGYARNARMVWLGADVCLAFIRDGSRGATHTATLAEAAGITTRRFLA